ncbi:MAG: hypothetical protein P9M15_01405 [Candidatus Electryoneaceae bacterium]|nr:hypothetical protein [Candidatus Electryoneaceae bacterium]
MYRGIYLIFALGIWLLISGTLPFREALTGNALWLRIAGALLTIGFAFHLLGDGTIQSGNAGIEIGIFYGLGLIAIVIALVKGQ